MIDISIFNSLVKNQNIAVHLRFLFRLLLPPYYNQKEADFAEKDLEIIFTKFVKAKKSTQKKMIHFREEKIRCLTKTIEHF
jgi:hypothetical protein